MQQLGGVKRRWRRAEIEAGAEVARYT